MFYLKYFLSCRVFVWKIIKTNLEPKFIFTTLYLQLKRTLDHKRSFYEILKSKYNYKKKIDLPFSLCEPFNHRAQTYNQVKTIIINLTYKKNQQRTKKKLQITMYKVQSNRCRLQRLQQKSFKDYNILQL